MSHITIQLCKLCEVKTGEIIRYRGCFFEKIGAYLIGQNNGKVKAIDCINVSRHNCNDYVLILEPKHVYRKFSSCNIGEEFV